MGKRIDKILRRKSTNDISKGIDRDMATKASRQPTPTGFSTGTNVKNGIFEQVVDPRVLILSVENNWMLGAAIDKIVIESTKEGYEWIPKWVCRCSSCGKTYVDTEPTVCDVKTCKGEIFTYPDREQLVDIEKVMDSPNWDANGAIEKPWMDIIRDLVFYNQTIDDYYLEVIRDGFGDVIEVWPISAEFIRIKPDLDHFKGNGEKFCPVCGTVSNDIFCKCFNDNKEHPLMLETQFVHLEGFTNKVEARWGKAELLHGNSRSWGTRIYGVPKIYSVWAAAQILRWMELYQWSAYSENKMPDSFVAFPNMKQKEINDMIDEFLEFKENNPQQRLDVYLGVSEAPIHVKTMLSLKDMMSLEMASFLREAIAIRYGVSLTMLGVMTPGKLGDETEQIEVSYDTISDAQSQINLFINEKFVKLFDGVRDWEWRLINPKKDDEARKETIKGTTATTLSTLRASGIDAMLDPDTWEIVIRDQPAPEKQQDMFGGMQMEKSLTPRDIPKASAIDNIRTLEDDFVKSLIDDYGDGIEELFDVASKAGVDKETLISAVETYNDGFIKNAILKSEAFASNVYSAGMSEELKSLGVERAERFTQVDVNAINVLKTQEHGIFDSISTFGTTEVSKFKEIIEQAYSEPGEFNLDKMVTNMRNSTGASNSSLERIARSETTKISNTGRSNQWKQYADPDKKEYHWVIANDKRTSDLCKAIAHGGVADIWGKSVKFPGNPYTLKELEELTEGFLAHPNCRSTCVRRPLDD